MLQLKMLHRKILFNNRLANCENLAVRYLRSQLLKEKAAPIKSLRARVLDKRGSLLIATIGCSLFSLTSAGTPAFAQGFNINHENLPKVESHKSRLKVYVRDETPIVKYERPDQPKPTYLIPTGLPAGGAAPVIVMPGPGAVAGGQGQSVAVPPGYALIDPSQPPPARFESNIPARGIRKPSNLPSGVTTGVHALMKPPAQPSAVRHRPGGMQVSTPNAAAPQVMTYTSGPQSGSAAGTGGRAGGTAGVAGIGSGGASSRVSTSVSAVLQQPARASLLKPIK